jgi:nicotinamidase-related amidase
MAFQFIPPKNVKIPEIDFKDKVNLPSGKTTLIIVDMQNDFVKEKGHLVVPAALQTVPNIKKLILSARNSNVRVLYTQDSQIEGDPEFEIWPEHCVRGSWGWQIVDELKPQSEDLVFEKNRYDGFYGTSLDHFLRNIWHIEYLVIVGTVSNICVLHTAASAGLRWYHVIIPADGISALNEFDQAMTLRQVSTLYAGDVVKTVNDIHFHIDLL